MIAFFNQCQQGFVFIMETEFGLFDQGRLIIEDYQQKNQWVFVDVLLSSLLVQGNAIFFFRPPGVIRKKFRIIIL